MEKIDVKNHVHQRYEIGGEVIPSVTQALSIINKPYLVAWANKIGLEGKKTTDITKKATMTGTLAHAYIQAFLESSGNFMQNVVYDPVNAEEEEIKQAALGCFSQFLNFYETYRPTTIETERSYVSGIYMYGGTIDYVARIDGQLYIIDFKTTDKVSQEYPLQLSAYSNLYRENGDVKEGIHAALLLLPKDGKTYKFVKYDPSDIDSLFPYFSAALKLSQYPKIFTGISTSQ